MSKKLEVIEGHFKNLTKQLATIDDFITDTENIPCDELLKKYRKREEVLEVMGFLNHMMNRLSEKQNEGQEIKAPSPIIQM